jgi:hypothetical protein
MDAAQNQIECAAFHQPPWDRHRRHCIPCSDTAGAVCKSALAASCNDILCDESQVVAQHRLEVAAKPGNRIPYLCIHINRHVLMKSVDSRYVEIEIE